MSKSISEIMAQAVDGLVEQRIKHAPFDKSYAGIISAILFEPDTKMSDSQFGTYKVRYNNTEKTFKINDGLVHQVGERVNVYVPLNNPNRIIVEPVVTRIVPYKIVYENKVEPTDDELDIVKADENLKGFINNPDNTEVELSYDRFIEHRQINTNKNTYDVESNYTLVVKNRDTDSEEVAMMILPNGQTITFEGW